MPILYISVSQYHKSQYLSFLVYDYHFDYVVPVSVIKVNYLIACRDDIAYSVLELLVLHWEI